MLSQYCKCQQRLHKINKIATKIASTSASTDQGVCSESGNMDAPTVSLLNGAKIYEEEFNFNAKHMMVPAALPPPLPSQPPPTPLGHNAKRHKKMFKSDAAMTPSLSSPSISPSTKNNRFNLTSVSLILIIFQN